MKVGIFEKVGHETRDFPENQLGASLKAVGAVLHVAPLIDFPENQLGASLKAVSATGQPLQS